MTALLRKARHLAWQAPRVGAVVDRRARPTRRGALLAVLILLPLWLPRPLMIGELSLAFALPFLLAVWALVRPAWPGSVRRALHGGQGRGLWLEALCVGAIVMLALLSMLVSPEPLRAFRVILPMAYAVCALILLARVPPPLQRRLVFGMLFAGVLTLGVALLLAQTGAGRALVMRDYRFLAFFENPNQLGVVIMAVWPLAIALLLNARGARPRLLCALMVVVLASAIFISGTKTALALCFVSAALTWLYFGSRSGSVDKTIVKLVIIGCVIVLAVPAILTVLAWATPDYYRRVDRILTFGVWEFPSMQTRGRIWNESLRLGLAHPLLGVGAGTAVLDRAHSHNLFLDYFRGMGVFGLAAAVALVLSVIGRGVNFLVSTWHKGMTDRPSDTITAAMYLGAIFYLLGNQLSDSVSPTAAFLFWMIYLGAYFAALPATASATAVARLAHPRATREWRPRARSSGATPGAVAQPV